MSILFCAPHAACYIDYRLFSSSDDAEASWCVARDLVFLSYNKSYAFCIITAVLRVNTSSNTTCLRLSLSRCTGTSPRLIKLPTTAVSTLSACKRHPRYPAKNLGMTQAETPTVAGSASHGNPQPPLTAEPRKASREDIAAAATAVVAEVMTTAHGQAGRKGTIDSTSEVKGETTAAPENKKEGSGVATDPQPGASPRPVKPGGDLRASFLAAVGDTISLTVRRHWCCTAPLQLGRLKSICSDWLWLVHFWVRASKLCLVFNRGSYIAWVSTVKHEKRHRVPNPRTYTDRIYSRDHA